MSTEPQPPKSFAAIANCSHESPPPVRHIPLAVRLETEIHQHGIRRGKSPDRRAVRLRSRSQHRGHRQSQERGEEGRKPPEQEREKEEVEERKEGEEWNGDERKEGRGREEARGEEAPLPQAKENPSCGGVL
ncbi:hypothetical protein RHMOL_Rhmol05G0039500 [Rhododendron molle]|uniref:Uncharacterized protein n=1 Tax=Rhododendron molle TaxID=49168 RepID=A0ACC0NKF7_RHOML|nr:hypothetical protein RHMOL_Rhmol05G0039500 [Rhododendron molle]